MPCAAPTIEVGGVTLSTNNYENAQKLINTIGSDIADPTADEYESYIAAGNNDKKVYGIQQTLPTQTEPPKPIKEEPKAVNESPIANKAAIPTDCPTWDGTDYDILLSPRIRLRDLTVGGSNAIGPLFPHQLNDGFGLTAQERFCNLKALCVNVLEPLWNKFGPIRINSGIRNENSVGGGKVSQHVKGQAADVTFSGWTYDTYWQNAAWIKSNIGYDQFIFEHSSKSETVWLHLSYSTTGGRGQSDPNKVMTMYRGQYSSGLKKYY